MIFTRQTMFLIYIFKEIQALYFLIIKKIVCDKNSNFFFWHEITDLVINQYHGKTGHIDNVVFSAVRPWSVNSV